MNFYNDTLYKVNLHYVFDIYTMCFRYTSTVRKTSSVLSRISPLIVCLMILVSITHFT